MWSRESSARSRGGSRFIAGRALAWPVVVLAVGLFLTSPASLAMNGGMGGGPGGGPGGAGMGGGPGGGMGGAAGSSGNGSGNVDAGGMGGSGMGGGGGSPGGGAGDAMDGGSGSGAGGEGGMMHWGGMGDDGMRPGTDHDMALQSRRAGKTEPLSAIVERLRGRHGGKVLDARLVRRGGVLHYQIRILDRHNRLLTLSVAPNLRKRMNFGASRRGASSRDSR